MFKIATTSIDTEALKRALSNSRAGALVTFEGWVRDNNEGKSVIELEYEAYETLCQSEAQVIFEEARQEFSVLEIVCVHRSGKLKVGEVAVWVGVASAHRDAGFKACRYIIDEIKARLPIWKKETYVDGTSGWVNCQACAPEQHAHEHNLAEAHK